MHAARENKGLTRECMHALAEQNKIVLFKGRATGADQRAVTDSHAEQMYCSRRCAAYRHAAAQALMQGSADMSRASYSTIDALRRLRPLRLRRRRQEIRGHLSPGRVVPCACLAAPAPLSIYGYRRL